ncbi:MAG: phosphatase PAP2 family protein [Betaproteobacteria bacterium]
MTLVAAALVVGLFLDGPQAAPSADSTHTVPGALPSAAPAQPPQKAPPPTPPHTGIHALLSGLLDDVKHLPSMPNLWLAAGGGGLALAVHPYDQTFNARLRSHHDTVNDFFAPGKIVGETPVQMGMALAAYGYGRLLHKPRVSHLGMDLLRGQIIAGGLTEGLKLATHRERPDGSNFRSFPSGHSSVTFASATVIERHLGWADSIIGYAVASYVAASRLHDNRHYLSDVVFGAAVGAIGGRTVTRHGRNVWTLAPVAVPGGVAIVAVRAP